MTAGVLEVRRELDGLVAIARGGGQSKSVFLYRSEYMDNPIAVATGNPANEKFRGTLASAVSDHDRIKCDILLRHLADAVSKLPVAADRSAPRTSDLPPGPAAWENPVSTTELLDEVAGIITKYVALPGDRAVAVALWVLHTYVPDANDFTPYLLITSPVRECGKSTLLDVLEALSFRAQLTGGITAAALYRRIDREQPTMLIDELDTRLRGEGSETLRGVLNTGFYRQGKVTICSGDSNEDRDFRTFCPKALAGIGQPWDTVASRSIPIRLSRASAEELQRLTKVRGDRIGAECDETRRRATRWASDHRPRLQVSEPDVPGSLGARHADIWRPLLAISDLADERWRARARSVACAIHLTRDEIDTALLLLEDLRSLFRRRGNPSVLFSGTIVEELIQLEERPWPEYRGGLPLTARSVAKLLEGFDLRPKPVREGTRESDSQRRGYRFAEFIPVFDKYLRPLPDSPSHASHPSHSPALSSHITADSPGDVTDVTDVTVKTEPGAHGSFDDSDDQYEIIERHAIQAGL